jgi:hypothetical protein
MAPPFAKSPEELQIERDRLTFEKCKFELGMAKQRSEHETHMAIEQEKIALEHERIALQQIVSVQKGAALIPAIIDSSAETV